MKHLVRSIALVVVTGVLVAGLAAVASARPAPEDPQAPSAIPAFPVPDVGVPCKTSIVSAVHGKLLRLGLACAEPEVLIARFDFSAKLKWAEQQPFAGGTCSGRGTSIWYCVFPAGIPAGKSLSGVLMFQKGRPAGRQLLRVTLFQRDLSDAEYYPGSLLPGRTAVLGF